MNANDKKIMQLKKQIAEKKAALSGSKTFAPVTNCSIEIFGTRYNLHALNVDHLLHLKIILNIYRMSAKDLGISDQVAISGYPVVDWMKDIEARLMIVNRIQEEAQLKAMESRLHSLLTNSTRASLEIEEIEKKIG